MREKKFRLAEICDIRAGHCFRQPPSYSANRRDPHLVQKSDLPGLKSGKIKLNEIRRVSPPSKNPFFLKKDDILLPSRGNGKEAMVLEEINGLSLIANSQLIIIRVKDPLTLLPRYLAALLNSGSVSDRLNKKEPSNPARILPVDTLNGLLITLPKIESQENYIEWTTTLKKLQKSVFSAQESLEEILAIPFEKDALL